MAEESLRRGIEPSEAQPDIFPDSAEAADLKARINVYEEGSKRRIEAIIAYWRQVLEDLIEDGAQKHAGLIKQVRDDLTFLSKKLKKIV